ncbi:MAG: ABC transporter ATP-binding protein [Acidobacteriota bacterium]
MTLAIDVQDLSHSYSRGRSGSTPTLSRLQLQVPQGSLVGLIGRNGCGKSTLLRHLIGDVLPQRGRVEVLGCPAPKLDSATLARIGMVYQRSRFIDWMSVEEHIRYVASFYPDWDVELEQRLVGQLELELDARVGSLSPGNVQKLALVLATGHRPDLLLLDEPAAGLDPFGRSELLHFLLELLRERHETTIVIASHVLRDVEKVVDHIVCLHDGQLTADQPLDSLQERYARWQVLSPQGEPLPHQFPESFVVRQIIEGPQAQLWTDGVGDEERKAFEQRHGVSVNSRALTLDEIFPLLTRARDSWLREAS